MTYDPTENTGINLFQPPHPPPSSSSLPSPLMNLIINEDLSYYANNKYADIPDHRGVINSRNLINIYRQMYIINMYI